VDEKRFQWHLTGLLSLTPNGTGGGFPAGSGAQDRDPAGGSRRDPLSQPAAGPMAATPVAAGGWGWGQETDPTAAPVPVGTKTSSGINFDFSWVYDGTTGARLAGDAGRLLLPGALRPARRTPPACS
jgi:hypothetical protein